MAKRDAVLNEEGANLARDGKTVPDSETVFSQARNGRLRRLEESLDLGFELEEEDDKGNTLLLIAAQNVNKKLLELLIRRGANVNHQNAQGNTALHFAMAYDAEVGESMSVEGWLTWDRYAHSFSCRNCDRTIPLCRFCIVRLGIGAMMHLGSFGRIFDRERGR